jgi:hypothetical protein
VRGKNRVWLLSVLFLVVSTLAVHAAVPTTIPGLLDAAARAAIEIFSSGYFIIALSIIILFILFKSIIELSISNLPWQNVDENAKKKLATTLALIMTLGLIGYSGYGNGSFSTGNIENNIGRVYGTLGGTAGPWILAVLIGSLVYFNISKNDPNKSIWSKLGSVLLTIGLVLWASQRISGSMGTGMGISLIILGIAFMIFGRVSGGGVGADGGLGLFNGNGAARRQARRERRQERREARRAQRALKKKQKDEENEEKSVENEETHLEKDDDSVKIRLAEVMDYLNQERNDLQHILSDKEKLEQVIKAQIQPTFEKMHSNKHDPSVLNEGFSTLSGVMDIIDKQENIDAQKEKVDKRKMRNAYRDMFRRVEKILKKDLKTVKDQLNTIKKNVEKGNAASNEVYQRYSQIQAALNKEVALFSGQNGSGINLHTFVLGMIQLQDQIINHDQHIRNEFKTVEDILENLKRHATTFENEADEEKKEILKEIFYKEFDKSWGKVQSYFSKITTQGMEIINDCNRFIKNIGFFAQLLAQLSQLTNFVEQEHQSIESLMADVHRFSEEHVEAYQENLGVLSDFNSMFDQIFSKYEVLLRHVFVDLGTFDSAMAEVISMLRNAEQKGQKLLQEFSKQKDRMNEEISAVTAMQNKLKALEKISESLKQYHDQFRGQKVLDISILDRQSIISEVEALHKQAMSSGATQDIRARYSEVLEEIHKHLRELTNSIGYFNLQSTGLSSEIQEYEKNLPPPLPQDVGVQPSISGAQV